MTPIHGTREWTRQYSDCCTGEYVRLQANAANRGFLSDDVVSIYDTSDLFKTNLPDFEVREIVGSANQWKEKCRQAQLAVSSLSSAHRDLGTCISSVTHFRDEVHRTILAEIPDRHDTQPVYVSGSDKAGFDQVILWVLDSNARARRFYEAGGWRADEAAKQDDSFGVPMTKVRYRRPLP
jgi:hypothetical protein